MKTRKKRRCDQNLQDKTTKLNKNANKNSVHAIVHTSRFRFSIYKNCKIQQYTQSLQDWDSIFEKQNKTDEQTTQMSG